MIEKIYHIVRTRLPRRSFARQVSILASGTAIAQAIPIAVSPILTRLYAPEEFGLVTLYISCAAVITVVATARYELAITLPASDEDAAHILIFTLKLCAAVCFLLYVPITIFNEEMARLLGNPELAKWFYLLPITVLGTGTFNVLQYWCNRTLQYRKMSVNRVQNTGFIAFANTALGLWHVNGGMVIGGAVGQLAATMVIGRNIWRNNQKLFLSSNLQTQIELAKRYRNHPKYIAPAQLIGVVAEQIPVFLISSLFTLATVGFFSMAYRLVSFPSRLIAGAIGDVYRQKISVAYNEEGEFRDIFMNTLRMTSLLAAPPFLALYFSAPLLFEFVFGESWRIAGEYAQILVVASFFQFIFTPIDKGAVVVGATRYILAWHLARLFGYLLLFIVSNIYNLSIQNVLWFFVAINLGLYVIDGLIEYVLAKGQISHS